MSDETGDIFIDGKAYRINLASYKSKDIVDFSPRATVPGNSSMMSDLSLYQPLVQTDWQHGLGFHWYSDAAGYLSTTGNIDTRHDGLAMLFTKAVQSESRVFPKRGVVIFNNVMYAWGDGGLYKYSEANAVDADPKTAAWTALYTATAVSFAMNVGDYLIFCPTGARLKKMTTAEVITDAGLDTNSTDYKWMIVHNGLIYAGKNGTNRIHFDTNADCSQLEGTTTDPEVIYCGIGNIPTLGAVVYAGNLYVSREDGLWQIGEDKVARRVLDFSDSASAYNFRSMAVVNGYLLFPIRDRIIQWNGFRTANVTPTRITDEYPYVHYFNFKNFVSVDNYLFCSARTNTSPTQEYLLCWDGVGWHKLMELSFYIPPTRPTPGYQTPRYDGETDMLAYESLYNRLWFSIDTFTKYVQFNEGDSFPYANFQVGLPYAGAPTDSLITSRLDMGFRRITKSAPSMFVEARNVTDTRYINVYYSADGAREQLWDKVTNSGITELRFPGGYPTIEFNYLILRFEFITDVSNQTPVMESYTLNFIMRPQTKMGYSFQIIAATNYENDMYADDRSASQILNELRSIRNSKSPVKFTGLMGEEIEGYLTSITESPIYRTETDVEYVIQCSFVETYNANTTQE